MAVTGIFFVLFVLMHSYGNLKILAGADAYNGYAHHLRVFGAPILPYEGLLWILRVMLLACVIIHMICAFYLWHRASKGRGSQKYVVKQNVVNNYATRTVRVGSVLLVLFILFHIFHFTTKWVQIGAGEAYSSATCKVDGEMIPVAPWNMMVTWVRSRLWRCTWDTACGPLCKPWVGSGKTRIKRRFIFPGSWGYCCSPCSPSHRCIW